MFCDIFILLKSGQNFPEKFNFMSKSPRLPFSIQIYPEFPFSNLFISKRKWEFSYQKLNFTDIFILLTFSEIEISNIVHGHVTIHYVYACTSNKKSHRFAIIEYIVMNGRLIAHCLNEE